jgi:phosphatidate phosphatase APP1
MFQRWPRRRFVLIGDSGEKDPEIYGDLARRFPEQVQRIDVRDLKGEGRDSPRMKAAFRDVPPEKWTLISAAEKAPETP